MLEWSDIYTCVKTLHRSYNINLLSNTDKQKETLAANQKLKFKHNQMLLLTLKLFDTRSASTLILTLYRFIKVFFFIALQWSLKNSFRWQRNFLFIIYLAIKFLPWKLSIYCAKVCRWEKLHKSWIASSGM